MAGRVVRSLGRAVRWAGCRFRPGGIILGYHRVATVPHDPWNLCVRPEHLAGHLEVLVRRGRPVPLGSLTAESARQRESAPVAVTFDDAYADVLNAAVPILERFEVPATVFVVTDLLGTTFWWDRLHAMMQAAPAMRIQVPLSRAGEDRLITVDTRQPLPPALHAQLRESEEPERAEVLARFRTTLGVPEASAAAPMPRAVTGEELATLARHPLIEVGAHTRTHPDLSRLNSDRAEREVAGSRRDLQRMTGTPVMQFAYPHGNTSPAARTAVERAGFAGACSGVAGRVRRGTDPLLLPRLWPPDVDGEHFARFLHRWTGL